MTSLPANCIPVSNTSLPVAIDYPAALALRQMALVQDELPKYLLAPEVSALLHYVPDLHRKMLLATLWNTGARINEALALTRGDFSLAPPYPFVQLATLKQRTEKAARTAGRMPAGQQTHRLVPLYTKVFALDVAARHRVQFLMPESDAIAMLKQLS
ncbi:tyrosine-type recombinase/integrase [Escherichia coli]|nr:tyrosine-type recombinase/integrase [Escherichia coli]